MFLYLKYAMLVFCFSFLLAVASILYQLVEFLFTSAKNHKAIEDFLFILSHQNTSLLATKYRIIKSTSELLTRFLINP